MIKKKAVSPLVATILLILVAVILVGMMLSWGQDFVQTNTSKVDSSMDMTCKDARVDFLSCNYDDSTDILTFTLINEGSYDFKEDTNFNVLVIDSQDNLFSKENINDSNGLSTGETTQIELDNVDLNAPLKVQVRNSSCTSYWWEETNCR